MEVDRDKIAAINELRVETWDGSEEDGLICVLAKDTPENRHVLLDAGFGEAEIQAVADGAGMLDLLPLAMAYGADHFETERGFGLLKEMDRGRYLSELSRQVADLQPGTEGYLGSTQCPQGHKVWPLGPHKAGEMCDQCVAVWMNQPAHYEERQQRHQEARAHAFDMTWHPEWRIGSGEPRQYATSPHDLADAEQNYRKQHPDAELIVHVFPRGTVTAIWGAENELPAKVGVADDEIEARCLALIFAHHQAGQLADGTGTAG